MLKNENILFSVHSDEGFKGLSLEIFMMQSEKNTVYKRWIELLGIKPSSVTEITQIPFLPIEFFKNFEVLSSPKNDNTLLFTSSGTSGQKTATHFVTNQQIYVNSFMETFKLFYGAPQQYCILALLPNYLQRSGSSLVYMCDYLIKNSQHNDSGFFLDNITELKNTIQNLKKKRQKVILIGVSYALMDLCDEGIELDSNFIVMETGGMKGRRKELLKPELHAYLKKGFNISEIHSEYGMTELLSQAYSKGDGLFKAPPWLKFLTRETDDPLKIRIDNRTGGINVIDLANINSCSFIATKDLGRIHPDGSLELMGRYDESDVRGCNLMLEGI